MRRILLILVALSPIVLLSGCTGGDGGGFDLIGFLQNPFVMIIIALFIVYYMMKKGKQ